MTLVCVNHWPVAIETHKRNHPTARHYVEDVTAADPNKLVPDGRLDLLMASPECRFYSRARGGRPVHDQSRMNPWVILRWLTSLDVRCLLVENVPEFIDWGPLLPDGTPDRRHRGQYFQGWYNAIRKAGYKVDWRMLNAADYGDATTRIRFFLIARKDRRPIVWPDPTHSPSGDVTMFGQLSRWRAAREIIEWSNPGKSLLDDPKYIKRPLSEKTRRRIARGLEKYGGPLAHLYINLLGLEPGGNGNGGGLQSFVMGKNGSPAYRGTDEPIPTVTCDGQPTLIHPTVEPFILGQQSCSKARSVDSPIPTVAAAGAISFVQPVVLGQHSGVVRSSGDPLPTCATHGGIAVASPLMVKYYGTGVCHPVDEPVPTVTTKDRTGLASPMVIPYRGEREGQSPRVHSVDEPVPTITAEAGFALANPAIIPYYGDHKGKQEPRAHSVDEPLRTVTAEPRFGLANPVLVEVNHGGGGDRSYPVEKPLKTITTNRYSTAVINPFLVQWDQQRGGNGAGVRSVDAPVPTIITKQNTGVVEPVVLVEPVLRKVEAGEIDARRLVLIDNDPYLLDLRFRMLTNLELARAMGFTDEEITYEFSGNISEVTRQIGNAVPVNLAKALVKAILSPIKRVEKQ